MGKFNIAVHRGQRGYAGSLPPSITEQDLATILNLFPGKSDYEWDHEAQCWDYIVWVPEPDENSPSYQ